MRSLQILNEPTVPPPYPTGWYAIGFSEELPRGRVLTRQIAGQDLVLFRTESGQAAAVDPYCPHLGAHLGQGGKVVGEALRCPFHGFCFDTEGKCVSTPYEGKKTPKIKARTWPVSEQNGILLVFLDRLRREPEWRVPVLSMAGWSPLRWGTFRFRGHPQDISENSVDLGHFAVVHGYKSAKMDHASSEGAYFHTQYRIVRQGGFVSSTKKMHMDLDVHVHGLGFSYVDVTLPQLNLVTRQFVLATPVSDDQVELRIAMAIPGNFGPGNIHPLLRVIPRGLFRRIFLGIAFRKYAHDVLQDVPVWNRKAYITPPALADGDGPIGPYRRWTKQFYEEAALPPLAAADVGAA